MINWLKRTFALSEQGAKDLNRAIWCCTATDMGLFLPIGLTYMILSEWICPYFDVSTKKLSFGEYTAMSVGILLVIYGLEHLQYNATFLKSYQESEKRRIAIAERLRKLPISFFERKDLSDLTTTILTDCADLERAFSRPIPELFAALFSLIPVSIMLFVMDWKMTIALLWPAPVSFFLCAITKKLQDRYSYQYKEQSLNCAAGIQECIENIGDIRACGLEKDYLRDLDGKMMDLEKKTMQSEIVIGVCVTGARMILKLGIATTMLVGGILLGSGKLDFISFLVFLIAASRIYESLSGVIGNMASVFNTLTQVERTREIMETPIQEGVNEVTYHSYDMVFDHVVFSYREGEAVLRDVSFTAKQGEITALVGPSGSGKTTVSKLAARFWDVDSGTVKLGGINISSMDPEAYLKNFSIVFQEVILFNNTIMENIRIGKDGATDDEVIKAANMAQCEEFILKLPEGYQTMIGENGVRLSGGERQRLSIARALLKDAPIVLLDEATASLDPENETKIQQAISVLTKNKTVLMIAHRMRTISNADKIVVLDAGRVVEEGTDAELSALGGMYAKRLKFI